MPEPVIRQAVENDWPALFTLVTEAAEVSEFLGAVVNSDHLERTLRELLRAPQAALFMAERGDQAVGLAGAAVMRHLVSGDLEASQIVWWVTPSRRGRIGPALRAAVEAWGRRKGAARIQWLAPNDRYARVLVRDGYAPAFTVMVKEF